MPTSKLEVAPRVLNLVWEVAQRHRGPERFSVLDVGPGWGKYAVLLREYVDPTAYLAGVEAWAPYIKAHRLGDLYDFIIAGDVREQPDEILAVFDLVLMVDVIEHLPKADALALLDRIPGWVVIATPRDHFDNPSDLPPTEAHVSHWTLDDFGPPRFDGYAVEELERFDALIVRLRPRETA